MKASLAIIISLFFISHVLAECGTYAKQCPVSGGETTVFIDFNDAPTEIKCVHKASCEEGKNLIVFPGRDTSVTKENFKVKFKEFIAGLDAKKTNVKKMIFSGHDGGSHYGGSKGDLGFNDVVDSFKGFDNLKNGIESFYGWGCYTATLNEVDTKWMAAFPNLKMILGYDLKAPLSDKQSGYEYLYSALKAEETAKKSKNVEEFKKALLGLEYANELHLAAFLKCEGSEGQDGTPALDGFYLSSFYGASTFKEAMVKCKDLRASLKDGVNVYQKYLLGELPMPAKPDLRDFYNKLRLTESCKESKAGLGQTDGLPSPDQVILLLYDHYVMANIFRLYSKDLQDMSALGESAYPGLNLKGLLPSKEDLKSPLYRKLFSQKIFEMNKKIYGEFDQSNKQEFDKKRAELSKKATPDQLAFNRALNTLNSKIFSMAVPIEWRDDPNSTKKNGDLIMRYDVP